MIFARDGDSRSMPFPRPARGRDLNSSSRLPSGPPKETDTHSHRIAAGRTEIHQDLANGTYFSTLFGGAQMENGITIVAIV